MSNELVESTRGKGEMFCLLWTFVIGLIIWIFLSFTLIDNLPNLISVSNLRLWMISVLFVYILGWGFGQTFLFPRGSKISSKNILPIQSIEFLVFTQTFNVGAIEVFSKDIGSDQWPIWGQLELGNRLIAKRCKWKFKYQKTIQHER